jgi:hypothetical protein
MKHFTLANYRFLQASVKGKESEDEIKQHIQKKKQSTKHQE